TKSFRAPHQTGVAAALAVVRPAARRLGAAQSAAVRAPSERGRPARRPAFRTRQPRRLPCPARKRPEQVAAAATMVVLADALTAAPATSAPTRALSMRLAATRA